MVFSRLSFPQIAMMTLLGAAGGVYVYKPIYEQYSKDQRRLKEKKVQGAQQLKDSEKSTHRSDCGCNN
ncbi:protein PIGBOS1 [Latimeria chalumnae]|uniref:protein PIGBOS1 n=1 Tax=Latimeria chalumnae TaxID=7897 RepID=UPI0006D91C16|nr:PREDICTED: protein PIGBOS1-like [Latimeria chalumnae]XP_014339841.1 PREDICTED: protein PIGBOS1-like [Latimeria chalumnae]XP_014339842.1 PREDICTED: protein PIGBOS1-like [Latimeria chalumnae]XP_014339843.1 PREDICTED: protein PIGBOS1-like [Latimeria chalumnae]|eukprot:XP_014339840.1 PREDICTED: protein PIGBOS1-like [Latimeria chalumnae]